MVVNEWPHLFQFVPMPALMMFFGALAAIEAAYILVRGADKGDE